MDGFFAGGIKVKAFRGNENVQAIDIIYGSGVTTERKRAPARGPLSESRALALAANRKGKERRGFCVVDINQIEIHLFGPV